MEDQTRKGLEAELRVLQSALYYSQEYGDWKIVKIYEYRLAGKDDPYNLEELESKRQAARDRINEIEALLKEAKDER